MQATDFEGGGQSLIIPPRNAVFQKEKCQRRQGQAIDDLILHDHIDHFVLIKPADFHDLIPVLIGKILGIEPTSTTLVLIGKLLAIGSSFLVNFSLSHFVVFRQRGEPTTH